MSWPPRGLMRCFIVVVLLIVEDRGSQRRGAWASVPNLLAKTHQNACEYLSNPPLHETAISGTIQISKYSWRFSIFYKIGLYVHYSTFVCFSCSFFHGCMCWKEAIVLAVMLIFCDYACLCTFFMVDYAKKRQLCSQLCSFLLLRSIS